MVDVRIQGAEELRKIAADLRKAGNKELVKQMRKSIRQAVKPVVAEMKSEAAQASTTVARTLTTETRLTGRSAGVRVRAKSAKMSPGHGPLPRLLENRGRPGRFRHPVFGDPQVWVEQDAHPFMQPVAFRNEKRVRAQLMRVLDETARAAGFH